MVSAENWRRKNPGGIITIPGPSVRAFRNDQKGKSFTNRADVIG